MNTLAGKQNKMNYTDFLYENKKYTNVIIMPNVCFLCNVPFQSSVLYNICITDIASSFCPNGSITDC